MQPGTDSFADPCRNIVIYEGNKVNITSVVKSIPGVPAALAHELRERGHRLELDGRRVQVVQHCLEPRVGDV